MESDNGTKKCRNCGHDIILGGDLWIHITTSDRNGRGGFDIPGKADIICSICGCRNAEPEM